MRTALIDGDLFVFESATRGEQQFDWDGDGDVVTHADLKTATNNLLARISTCVNATGADKVIIAFGDPKRRYWRHKILPSYKQHRGGRKPPELLGDLRAWAEKNYRTRWWPGLEADDVLGVLMTSKRLLRGDRVCVSRDKDMLQIPGEHLNHAKVDEGQFIVSRDEGQRHHMFQTLVGDTCDNYKGCPGVGPKKADAALDEAEELWTEGGDDTPFSWYLWGAVMREFSRRGHSKAAALTQARVSYILQADHFDVETGKVTLWSPP